MVDVNPMIRVQKQLQRLRGMGKSYRDISSRYGLHPIEVKRVIEGDIAFSEKIIKAVLEEDWTEIRVVYKGKALEGNPVITGPPPRLCPVTGEWFVPGVHNQVYHPLLPELYKNRYRRNGKPEAEYTTV